MTSLVEMDLTECVTSFGLANAPLFFLRRLLSDQTVQRISREIAGEDLLSALKALVSKKPKTLVDEVKPYVYLVALSLQANQTHFKMAASINFPNSKWYEYFARFLNETRVPYSNNQIISSPVTFSKRPAPADFGFAAFKIDARK